MKAFTHIILKMEGMRKPQSFIIYPYDGSDFIKLQSDTRIMQLNVRTGEGILSKPHPNGSYFQHLSTLLGSYPVKIQETELKTIQQHLWESAGLQSDKHGILHIENKELFSKGQDHENT